LVSGGELTSPDLYIAASCSLPTDRRAFYLTCAEIRTSKMLAFVARLMVGARPEQMVNYARTRKGGILARGAAEGGGIVV